ncbi:MAG: tetratricopeptide repeat protein [Methylococcales bacterium]|nr:tetratricopeptide repeat protein [Methylococcales bacterium]
MKPKTPTAKQIALFQQANGLHQSGQLAEALAIYKKLLQNFTADPELLERIGTITIQQGHAAQALPFFDRSLQIAPGRALSHCSRGIALQQLNRPDQALAAYQQAIRLKPDYADAYINRGVVCQELRRHDEALDCFDRAIALEPHSAPAHINKAVLLQNLKRYEESLANFSKARQLDPDYEFIDGQFLYNKLQLCDWDALETLQTGLFAKIDSGLKAAMPWHVLSFTDDPARQQKAAECWAQNQFPAEGNPQFGMVGHDKIRIAYVSADFYMHPVAILTAGLYENHDRRKFEIFAFHYGRERDEMTARLEAGFDRFIDIGELSDQQVIQLARSLEIDIAVDLAGYTGDSRTGLFANRLAPLQVSYLGYAGTMAAACMDYMIADSILIPETGRRHYAEKIVYMPNSFQANDDTRQIAATVFSREAFGLPEKAFVYCCFNNSYKIHPDTFRSWMRILAKVDGGVLWLPADYETQAVELAAIKNVLQRNRLTAPLFDTRLFTRHLEAAYTHMYQRYAAGLPADDILVDA